MSTPYTYLIGWSSENIYYYGAKYGKDADPFMLWKNYFTSSKIVKNYRKKYGEPDIIQIRKEFDCSDRCRLWEHKVLRRMGVKERRDFLNITHNMGPRRTKNVNKGRKGIGGVPKGTIPPVMGKKACYNPKTNKIIFISSIEHLPEGFVMGGPAKTKEHNLKNSLAHKGRKHSDEARLKMSKVRKGKQTGSNNPRSRAVIIENIHFGCVKDAAEHFRVSTDKIGYYEKHGVFGPEPSEYVCPHCNIKTKNRGNLNRWHLDNCKNKKHDHQ